MTMLRTADHIAIAGGAVAAALVNRLVAKGILTTAEAVEISDAAADSLAPFATGAGAGEAARIIAEWRQRYARA
jgi:hypothetical protein